MRIVTNPGSNVPRQALDHYGIEATPQQIIESGTAHDTRTAVPYATIDRWIRTSPEFPHVVGTTAQEFVALFSTLAREDPEICVVLTSKQIIQSHAAAVSAARTMKAAAAFKNTEIAVIDTRVTDCAAGLLVLAAGEAQRAKIGLRKTQRILEILAERVTITFVPGSLDNLVKGGRAGWARAQLAGLLQLLPMVGFRDGELASIDRVRRSGDHAEALVEHARKTHGKGRPVWAVALHSDTSDERALNLLARVRAAFDVRYSFVRPLAAGSYIHAGAGTLGLAILPVDGLPWELPVPPPFGR